MRSKYNVSGNRRIDEIQVEMTEEEIVDLIKGSVEAGSTSGSSSDMEEWIMGHHYIYLYLLKSKYRCLHKQCDVEAMSHVMEAGHVPALAESLAMAMTMALALAT
jgi:hypothetical protein